MSARILTQLAVDKAKPRPARYEIPDGPGGVPGFALRVGGTKKVYVVRVRVHGAQRRVLLGNAAVLPLAEARARARKIVDQAREGIDPAPREAPRRDTVAVVVEEYLARHVRRNLKSAAATERRLKRDIVAAWGTRPVDSIRRRDVVALADDIADRGAPVSANRTLQLAHRFFAWCVKRSIIEANPAAGIDLPHREHGRDRTLSDAELAAAWGAFEGMGWPWGDLGRLLALSGARRSEWAGARWSEIDFDRQLWTVPPERHKAGHGHELPLTPMMIEILEAMPRVDGEDLLFPSARRGRPISAFSNALKWAHEASGTSGWSWHDLRRTLRTGLSRLGVQPHVAERVLGHTSGSKIERTYDRHRYAGEVRGALLRWQAELERITRGGPAKVLAYRA